MSLCHNKACSTVRHVSTFSISHYQDTHVLYSTWKGIHKKALLCRNEKSSFTKPVFSMLRKKNGSKLFLFEVVSSTVRTWTNPVCYFFAFYGFWFWSKHVAPLNIPNGIDCCYVIINLKQKGALKLWRLNFGLSRRVDYAIGTDVSEEIKSRSFSI
jgi:hypothetical protein